MTFSEGFQQKGVADILRERIPGCVAVQRATNRQDRAGTDWWAIRKGLPPLSVDVKVRSRDFKALKGQDDLALETWSVCDEKAGWTRDSRKRTDYVLWWWQDTGRFVLVPFAPLCRIFGRYWRDWREKATRANKVARQTSGSWDSECIYVPRELVMRKISEWMNGVAS